VRLAVTNALHPSTGERASAREVAARLAVPWVERGRASLADLADAAGADALLVLSARTAALFVDGAEHAWSAGMAELRLKRITDGEAGAEPTRDGFLDAADLRPGDAVLDATVGLGGDALVAAAAVGPEGRVVGLERSPALAALVAEGLARHASDAARRVAVTAADAAEVLALLPDKSFDVVAFDPMFRHARRAAAGFDLVRRLGDAQPLAPETLAAARRVARRWVVVKDGTPGWDLARLGLSPLPCARWAERLYARVPPL
jgi:hypothetical protein